MNRFEKRSRLLESQQTYQQPSCCFAQFKALWKFGQGILIGLQCGEQIAVKFLFLSELKPIVFRAMFWFGDLIARLRSNMDFLDGSPVILAFGLMEQDGTVRIANFKTVLLLQFSICDFVSPGALRSEVGFFLEDDFVSQCDSEGRSWNSLVHVEAGHERVFFPA